MSIVQVGGRNTYVKEVLVFIGREGGVGSEGIGWGDRGGVQAE